MHFANGRLITKIGDEIMHFDSTLDWPAVAICYSLEVAQYRERGRIATQSMSMLKICFWAASRDYRWVNRFAQSDRGWFVIAAGLTITC